MQIQITDKAYRDLKHIRDYIETDSVSKAQEVAKKILTHTNNQLAVPAHGKKGLIKDTFELKVPKLPYIVVYRINKETYEILHIYHEKQYRV